MSSMEIVPKLLYQENAYKKSSDLPKTRPRCPQSAFTVAELKIVFLAQDGLVVKVTGSNLKKC